MEAQAWTAIGLLAATLLGALFYLGNRIDVLGSGLRTEMQDQFQAQGSRIDGLTMRIDGLSMRIDVLGSDLRTEMQGQFQAQGSRIDTLAVRVEEQGAQLADRIYELATKLGDHLRWHAS